MKRKRHYGRADHRDPEGARGRAEDGRPVAASTGSAKRRFYNWKAKYGGLEVSEAKRLKGLESENAKLKQLLADAMPDNAALKDLLCKKMVTPAAKREAVAHLRSSFRRERAAGVQDDRVRADDGCGIGRRRPDDAELRQRLRALAHERRRFGYRRLHVLLRREGFTVNHKRLVPALSRGGPHGPPAGRPQAGFGHAGADAGPAMAERPLVARLRCRPVHRRPPHAHPGRGRRLHARMPGTGARHLDLRHPGRPRTRSPSGRTRGKPKTIVSDNGTELTSNAILRWADDHKVEWHYIAPGKPMQNAFVEVLHRPFAGRVAQ